MWGKHQQKEPSVLKIELRGEWIYSKDFKFAAFLSWIHYLRLGFFWIALRFWKTTDVMRFIGRDTLLLPPSRVSVFQRFTSFFCPILALVITSVSLNADPVASLRLNWAGSASGTCYSCNTRICSYFNYCLSFLTTAPHIFNVSAPRACPGENIETFRASLQNEVLPLILRDAVIDNHTVALLYCGGRPSAVNFRHRSEMVWALGCEALSCWQQNRSRVIVQGWTGWATALR